MTKSYHHGHLIVWDEKEEMWNYVDTGRPIDPDRPCFWCGWPPTPEGHDACIGHIPGASGACCGHGRGVPYVMWWPNDESFLF